MYLHGTAVLIVLCMLYTNVTLWLYDMPFTSTFVFANNKDKNLR